MNSGGGNFDKDRISRVHLSLITAGKGLLLFAENELNVFQGNKAKKPHKNQGATLCHEKP